jgi:microcystin-dependent protein
MQGFAKKISGAYFDIPLDTSPIGTVQQFGGATAPSGWLFCNGASLLRTDYAELFTAVGTTYGSADGTHFNVPDCRGVFVKGAGTNGTLTTANGSSLSGTLGAYEDDMFQGHWHTADAGIWRYNGSSGAYALPAFGGVMESLTAYGITGSAITAPITDGTNGTPRVGSTTRPSNVCLNYIIKAFTTTQSIFLNSDNLIYPSGMVAMHGGSAPSGWLLCDGSSLLRTSYPALFAAIGTTFGSADGTHFNVPDFRGIFPRGAGSNGTLTNANGSAFAGTLGTYQNDKMQGHIHPVASGQPVLGDSTGKVPDQGNGLPIGSASTIGNPATDGTNGTPRTGTETNPANLAVNFIIKE